MKRGSVNAEVAELLARLAGFDFSPERCQILAPQLAWMLEEAARVEALDRDGIEPVTSFQLSVRTGHTAGVEHQ